MKRRLLLPVLAGLLLAPVAAPAAELRARGLLDLALTSGSEGIDLNRYTQGDSDLDPWRLHLFLDARVSPTIDVYAQMILHEGAFKSTADGAYAQWTPWPKRDAHLQAGKLPWPIGAWAPRAYSDKNSLVGTPLMFQYHTSLSWSSPIATTAALVANHGRGQASAGKTTAAYNGMPIVDDRWWDVGVVALGSERPFEYAVGVTQGSPGWPVSGYDNTPGSTVLGRVGLVPLPGARVGVSGAWGTWMPDFSFTSRLPAGRSLRDYHEGIAMADAEFSRGAWELRGEGFLKEWETISLGVLRAKGGYAEARWSFADGAWLAVRAETLHFGEVTVGAGDTRPWDDGVDRFEACVGYRVQRDVRLKAGFQRNVLRPFASDTENADAYVLAASIRL